MGEVISLNKKQEEKSDIQENKEENDFTDIMRKNYENNERLKRERMKDNRGVKRSYRLKGS